MYFRPLLDSTRASRKWRNTYPQWYSIRLRNNYDYFDYDNARKHRLAVGMSGKRQSKFNVCMAAESACGFDTWNGVDETQYYPVQANARGGIGQVLAIGAKAGKHLLTADSVEGGTSYKTTVMGVSGKLSGFEPDEAYFKFAARDWEARDKVRPGL